ncbi:DUF3429 domain-containing protein [Thalassotalea ganghwensis]
MYVWKMLGYLGLVPFIAAILLLNFQEQVAIDIPRVFIAYSAVIVSFIAGSMWRVDQHQFKRQQIVSNMICLFAFTTLLIDQTYALSILIACYLILFAFEHYLHNQCGQPNDKTPYMTMRFRLSLIVIVCHLFMLTKSF